VSLIIEVVLVGGCTGNETQTVTKTQITGTKTQIIEVVTPREAFNMILNNRNNPDFVIIDIRTWEEFVEGFIEGAINIDYYSATFEDELDSIDKNKTYLIYCQRGNRSRVTLNAMEGLKFREVYDIKGGIEAWLAEGLLVMDLFDYEVDM